ncbi:MAG: L-histidine N(alpha)-methyltransferase [Ectothiorhodospiraceae bacterium]|nr:L-histidine N(alpha)-methyltransferase [Chromatiales bacterium]MCP5157065.1 L-histidine N(alpha)-methyltransferase [Ectothiorhodospiraceae bacterium]
MNEATLDLGPLEAFHDYGHAVDDLRELVVDGLSRRPKTLPSKLFYDQHGSALFDQICELPEYYVTRTEVGMLEQHADEIARCIGDSPTVIEFGAGSSRKIRLLLDALQPPAFVPIDISRDHLVRSARALAAEYPRTSVVAVCADFTRDIDLPPEIGEENRVGFFPGSTLGNFSRADAESFLRGTRELLDGGGFLIGIDLKKDPAILHAAYNDAAGVTAAFNRNVLARINRELDGDFAVDRFRHDAPWVEEEGRVEMHLVSECHQVATVDGQAFSFEPGESIHTENSHKYEVDEFRALARRAGYEPREVWVDDDALFSLHYLAGG